MRIDSPRFVKHGLSPRFTNLSSRSVKHGLSPRFPGPVQSGPVRSSSVRLLQHAAQEWWGGGGWCLSLLAAIKNSLLAKIKKVKTYF